MLIKGVARGVLGCTRTSLCATFYFLNKQHINLGGKNAQI